VLARAPVSCPGLAASNRRRWHKNDEDASSAAAADGDAMSAERQHARMRMRVLPSWPAGGTTPQLDNRPRWPVGPLLWQWSGAWSASVRLSVRRFHGTSLSVQWHDHRGVGRSLSCPCDPFFIFSRSSKITFQFITEYRHHVLMASVRMEREPEQS